jgi:hypothetical protein
MTSKHDEIERLLTIAEAFADEYPQFDRFFTDSLRTQFDEKGSLSDKQIASLHKMVDNWKMEERLGEIY